MRNYFYESSERFLPLRVVSSAYRHLPQVNTSKVKLVPVNHLSRKKYELYWQVWMREDNPSRALVPLLVH